MCAPTRFLALAKSVQRHCGSSCSNCPLLLLFEGQTGSGGEPHHLTWTLGLTSYRSQSLGPSDLCNALGTFVPFKTRTPVYPVSQRDFSVFLIYIHVFTIKGKKGELRRTRLQFQSFIGCLLVLFLATCVKFWIISKKCMSATL